MKRKQPQNWERIVMHYAMRMTWKSVVLIFVILVLVLYFMFTVTNNRYIHKSEWYKHPAVCETPKDIVDKMVTLTFDVSDILTQLKMSHTLCYGTLWGALRYGVTLPWDNNVDFCMLRSEIEKVDWKELEKAMKSNGMEVTYDGRHGNYIITRGPAEAILSVFYTTPAGTVYKDGFIHRISYYFQSEPLSFPQKLLEAPFQKVAFHGRPMPVPNSDMDIMKHLYKDDWWLEMPPPGCERATF